MKWKGIICAPTLRSIPEHSNRSAWLRVVLINATYAWKYLMGIVLGWAGVEPLPPLWITEIAGIGKGQQHSSLDTHQNGTCCSNCCHCSCSCCCCCCCPVWPVSHKACSLICACPGVCFACSAGKSPSSPSSSCEADFIMPFVSGCFGGFRGPGVD